MSYFGVDIRNSLAIGLGGIISLLSGFGQNQNQNENNLLTESGNNLVQEDGGLILLES
jgi:hypothetical protein